MMSDATMLTETFFKPLKKKPATKDAYAALKISGLPFKIDLKKDPHS
jgi:hypothetical protein